MKKIKQGDYVGVISSSGLLKEKNKAEIEKSIKLINEIGLNVKLGKYTYESNVDNLIKNKISDFNDMIVDKKIKMIIFSKGGNNVIDILDSLDYETIKNNPKIYVGLSDLTIILNAIYKKTNLITFHHLIFKGILKNDFNKKAFIDMFLNHQKEISFSKNVQVVNKGTATGTLIGGNLISFSKILNTEYMPNLNNSILFLEECDEVNKEEVENILIKFKQNHVFDLCNGIILGNYSIDNNYFKDIFKKYVNKPMIKCEDFGHSIYNLVLPIGANVVFDANNKKIEIIEEIFD